MRRWIGGLPGWDPFDQADGCVFDEAAADHALGFFPAVLRHVKGSLAGQPFELTDHQKGVVANLFGWKNAETGARRFNQVFYYVSKKQGKTTLAAGLVVYMLGFDDEMGGEVYSIASSKEQASLIFSTAAGMVRQDEGLRRLITPYGIKGGSQQKSLVHDGSMSTYRPLTADADTNDGVNPSFIVADELHRHRDGELVDLMRRGMRTRRQPILMFTTTADFNRPSICNTTLAYARAVRDNKGDPAQPGFDPAFLPVIYEASDKDDWEDPATWRKANPHLGVTFSEDDMRDECRRAKEMPAELNSFLRLNLNIVTDTDVVWIPKEDWAKCEGPEPWGPGWAERCGLIGQESYWGVDLGATADLTSLTGYFPKSGHVLSMSWIPKERAHHVENIDRVPYALWERMGLIERTPGDVVDYDVVRMRILQILKPFRVQSVGYDPWHATQMSLQLQAEGLPMVEYRQGFKSISEPMRELERLIRTKAIVHGGSPLLAWCMSNVVAEMNPAGGIKPNKAKATGRIDPIVALIMAVGRKIVQPIGGGARLIYVG